MTHRPASNDVPLIVADLRDAAAWIDHYAASVLDAEAPDLTEGGGGGGHSLRRGSDVSDPTGNAAVAGTVHWLDVEQAHLRADLDTLHDTAHAVVKRLGDAHRRLWPDGARQDADEDDEAKCRQGCGGPAVPGEQGNCRRCGQWLRDNRYADGTKRAQVSSDYLAARRERDEKRRVHVTGPLADEVA